MKICSSYSTFWYVCVRAKWRQIFTAGKARGKNLVVCTKIRSLKQSPGLVIFGLIQDMCNKNSRITILERQVAPHFCWLKPRYTYEFQIGFGWGQVLLLVLDQLSDKVFKSDWQEIFELQNTFMEKSNSSYFRPWSRLVYAVWMSWKSGNDTTAITQCGSHFLWDRGDMSMWVLFSMESEEIQIYVVLFLKSWNDLMVTGKFFQGVDFSCVLDLGLN